MQVCIHSKVKKPASALVAPVKGADHMELFMNVYHELQKFLLRGLDERCEMDANRARYLKIMMDTTCLGGKYNRGLCVVDVAEAMANANPNMDAQTKEQILHRACICGWAIEMLQAHFLVEDDIMDHSVTRRGKPCWYRFPGVTTQSAINDGLIVMAWASQLIMHYFDGDSAQAAVLAAFHNVDYMTTIGQLYDVSSMYDSAKLDPEIAQPTTTDYHEFTLFNYKRIVKYKTAFYTYLLPLQLGLLCSSTEDCVDMSIVHRVAMLMGEYFQVQDDVMDCFTDPSVLGKIGTDIEDAKCSWIAVTFLANASAEQIATFKANYGQREPEKVAIIKQLYAETKMQEHFAAYENETAEEVGTLLHALEQRSPAFAQAAGKLWSKTYKRSK